MEDTDASALQSLLDLPDDALLRILALTDSARAVGAAACTCRALRELLLTRPIGLVRASFRDENLVNAVDDAFVARMCGPGTEIADLSGCWRVTDASLAHLGRSGTIRELDLSGCKNLTDAGLDHVEFMGRVERVGLAGTLVTDAGVRKVAALGWVRSIDTWGCPRVGDAAIGELAGAGVAAVRLGKGLATPQGLAQLARARGLRSLDLQSFTGLCADDVVALAGLRELESLSLGPLGVSYAEGLDLVAVEALASMPALRDLTLDGVSLLQAGPLAALTSLRELGVSFRTTAPVGLAALASLPRLTALTLECDWADNDLADLSGLLERLEYLSLKVAPPDPALASLAHATALTWLALDCTPVSRDFLETLPPLPALRAVELSRAWVTLRDLGPLARFPALREVHVCDSLWGIDGGNEVERLPAGTEDGLESGVEGLPVALEAFSFDKYLGLSLAPLSHYTGLTRVDVTAVGEACDVAPLASLTALRMLSLTRQGSPMCTGMSHLSALTALTSLSLRRVTDEDMCDFGAVLSRLSRLDHLALHDCKLRIDPTALASLTSLCSLAVTQFAPDLSIGACTDQHLRSLSRLPRLEELSIYGLDAHRVSSAGMAALAEVVSLEKLVLWYAEGLGPECFERYRHGLTRLTHLHAVVHGPNAPAMHQAMRGFQADRARDGWHFELRVQ